MNRLDNAVSKLSINNQMIIFLVALIARIVYLLPQVSQKTYLGADTRLYLEIAQNILDGNGFAVEHGATAFVAPAFPIFLSACIFLFGENMAWASVIQCILASITCVVIAKIAVCLFDKSTGFIAGIIAALYYELIMWGSTQLLTEPLYIFFLALAIYYLTSAIISAQNKVWFYSLCGGFFGLAGLVRPLALPIAVSVTVFLLFLLRRKRQELLYPFILIFACLLVMMPWGLRNYFTLNHFTLLSLEGGHVFWLGNNPEYDRFETKQGGYTAMFLPFPEDVRRDDEVQANQSFSHAAWQHIFEHPVNFIIRGFHKMWNMWRPAFSGSSWRNLLVSWTVYPLLLISSLRGIFNSLKSKEYTQRKLVASVLVWILLTHLAIHFLITGEIRFRVPLWVVLIPFSALALRPYTFLISRVYAKRV